MAIAISQRLPALRRRLPLMPRTLFGRSLLIVVIPIIALQLVITVIFYDRHWETVTRWLAIGVAGEVAWIVHDLQDAPDHVAKMQVLATARAFTGFSLSLEPGGRLEPAVRNTGFLPSSALDDQLRQIFSQALNVPFEIDTRPEQVKRIAVYVQVGDDLLRVLAPRKRVDSGTTTIFMAWMFGSAVVLLAIAVFFLGRQARPIRRLARAAESFGKGRDIGDFKLEGAIEIRKAGLAFNRMRQRINRHLAQRTEMLAAVSHDLSTPLTRMSLELELMSEGELSAEHLDGLREDVREMRRLVDAYLDFARGELQEQMSVLRLGELLKKAQKRANRYRHALTVTLEQDGVFSGRSGSLERALANLIDNAFRHAEHIWLTGTLSADDVILIIDDDGPGIAKGQRELVFKPFFRGDTAEEGDGVGMGLTIARDIVLGHGGTIELDDAPAGGLRVTIRLPR